MSMQNANAGILIVDDDEDDFIITSEYIRSIPGNSFKIHWCRNYNKGLKHLLNGDYNLYFVDYRLGAKSGVDFLKEAAKNNSEAPIVLLTGKGNYEVDIQAMQLGAIDYLVKTELSVEKMERCIRYALERAATLKALRYNERKFRSIFEKSKDVVFVTNHTLDFLDVNDAVQNLLGYEKQEVLKMNLYDLVGAGEYKNILQHALIHKTDLHDREVVLTTRAGEKKHCIITLTLEETDKDEGYLQGIIHDITNLKKEETAKIQVEKLAAAGRLVRTIAHEVRNPLNNITLSIEQMPKDTNDDSMMLYMDIIQRNSKRISDLINELLNTSHPAENVLQKHALQTIVDDVIASSLDRLTLKQINLQIHYPDEPLEIMADQEKLKLAILNIIINAIEAMEEKTGRLSILLQKNDKNSVLSITDNGCGISEENISRLFEPYFTRKRNGVGLGLAFTLNILQSHKAKVEVSSIPGTGTTFTLTFPNVTAEQNP